WGLGEPGYRRPFRVLPGFWRGEEGGLLKYPPTPAITECEQLGLLERAAASFGSARGQRARSGPVGFHLKIDTGMNRLGIRASDAECFARALGDCPHLRLEGTFTHFASAEVFTVRQTEAQQKRF